MPEPATQWNQHGTRSTRPVQLIPPQRSASPVDRPGQDAELASLIRRLAVIRPEILTPCETRRPRDVRPSAPPPPSDIRRPAPPQPLPARPLQPARPPRPVAATVSAVRPPRTRAEFPVDHESLATIDRLRAMTNGAHKPDDYWPRHADGKFRARMRRPPLRRRLPRALERWTRLTCMATGALTLTAFPIAAVALMVLSTPAV